MAPSERTNGGEVDHAVFVARLVEPYYAGLYSYACGTLLDKEDASDVVQDAYAKAWRAYPRFEGIGVEASEKSWIYTILTNQMFDVHRRRRARPRSVALDSVLGDENISLEPPDLEAGPEDIANALVVLRQVLARFDEKKRATIWLRIAGMTQIEIAKILDVERRTVMRWLKTQIIPAIAEAFGVSVQAAQAFIDQAAQGDREEAPHER